jgi:hypothetical protein
VAERETVMEHSRSAQFNGDRNKTTPKVIKSSTPSGYGYKGVNELLDLQIKQEKLRELKKKNSKI